MSPSIFTLVWLIPSSLSLVLGAPTPEPFAIPLQLSTPEPLPRSLNPSAHSIDLRHSASHIARSIDASLASRSLQSRDALDPNWLLREEAKIDTRYNDGLGEFSKLLAMPRLGSRAGEVQLTNHNLDASYSGQVSIGTPGQTFDVVLDTGSADLWVAGSTCSGCGAMRKFNAGASSSHVTSNSSFGIQYGSGSTQGHLAQDTVSMGGYSVASQTFAISDAMSSGLISDSLSGIMGLSFAALAYSRAIPWWVNLVQSGAWSQPLFGFYLARFRDVAGASRLESNGGKATFGYLDSSLYSGGITYINVPSGSQYWQIPMDRMTMQGTSISMNSGSVVAVDTGTTLIGGPADTVASIFGAIVGARQMTGAYRNYYEYPCTTKIDFQIAFGGFTIRVTDRDFNLGRYGSDQSYCTGAVFIQNLPAGSPVQWILGDSALKNVYSVYRFDPPAVGFAALAGAAGSAQAGTSAAVVPSGGSLGDANPGVATSAEIVSSALTASPSGTAASGSRSGTASASGASGTAKSSGTSRSSGTASATTQPGVVVATVTAVVTAADAASIGVAASGAAVASAGRTSGAGLSVDRLGASIYAAFGLGLLGFACNLGL